MKMKGNSLKIKENLRKSKEIHWKSMDLFIVFCVFCFFCVFEINLKKILFLKGISGSSMKKSAAGIMRASALFQKWSSDDCEDILTRRRRSKLGIKFASSRSWEFSRSCDAAQALDIAGSAQDLRPSPVLPHWISSGNCKHKCLQSPIIPDFHGFP